MEKNDKNNMQCPMLIIVSLAVSYLIVRYPLFQLHQMGQGPLLALIPSVIGLFFVICDNNRTVTVATACGYLISFLVGLAFHKSYIDSSHGGELRDNLFKIWIISYLVIIVFSIFISKRKRT